MFALSLCLLVIYGKDVIFSKLILYPVTKVKVLILLEVLAGKCIGPENIMLVK